MSRQQIGTYAQAEITGDGPFDEKEMRARKDVALRMVDKDKCYPNTSDDNLGTMPGDFLIARMPSRNEPATGGQKLAVFSSFNGFWWGRYTSSQHEAVRKEAVKRHLLPVGICKTQKNYGSASSAGSTGGNKTDNYLAWISSGKAQLLRNTGPECIMAGDLVCLDLPPMTPQRSLNSNVITPYGASGHGMPNGKYVMITKRFCPFDFTDQITYMSLLWSTRSDDPQNPGIADLIDNIEVEYKNMKDPKKKKDYTSSQIAAFMLLKSIFSLSSFVKILESKLEDYKEKMGFAIFFGLNHANRSQREFFINNIDKKDQKFHTDCLPDLFGAFGELAYERNRWVIGRCEETSKPGDPLVVNLGAFAHPCSM